MGGLRAARSQMGGRPYSGRPFGPPSAQKGQLPGSGWSIRLAAPAGTIEVASPVWGLRGLFEHQEELMDARLPGGVRAKQDSDGREANRPSLLPCLEVRDFETGDHRGI